MNGMMVRWCLLGLLFASPLFAEEFRIETKIYQGEEELPISETMTLFHSGAVYDFLDEPAQIAVYHKPSGQRKGRFILLDPERELRTELSTDRIKGALSKVRKWAEGQPDPMLRFAAAPQFEETFTKETGELVLASHIQTYKVKTTPAPQEVALGEYRQFLDWYTQLNAMHQRLPPQPRLEVNAAMSRLDVLPLQVERLEFDQKAEEAIRAEHDFTWRLSQRDHSRIDEVRNAMSNYKQVSNGVFLKHGE